MCFVLINLRSNILIEYPATKNLFATLISGRVLGDFIARLNQEYEIPFENVQIVGHSFGAHIAGFAGKRVFEITQSKVWRIIGMDPSGPRFEEPSVTTDKRLYYDDAEIVVAIHTDIGGHGFEKSIGAIDFFPNSGWTGTQPGCIGDGKIYLIPT